MTAIKETKSILRRIIYVTIFCFAIYGITSIGILVDKSRKKTSVSLSTALILLAILLAFLVIFTVIICLWRRATQNIKSRHHGRDEEELYTTSPGGHRYIRTGSELRAIKRKGKYERRQKDRRRSIWDHIHHAGDRINGRQISNLRGAKDERGDPLRALGLLDSHPRTKDTFVPKQEPLFGHGNGTGIFGGRPAVGAGLNPNHSRSPPASPCSPSRARRTDGKITYPPKAYHRPAGSVYTEKEFEEWARTQQNPNLQKRSPWKESHVLASPHVHREEGGVASDHVEGEKKGGVNEGQRQETTGAGREVPEEKMAVLNASPPQLHPNTSPSRHIIPRKEVGTPTRRDPGILGAKLHDGQAGVLMRESGVTIGYGGERVIMGPGRLPSKLVGHGLMAMPSQAHFSTSKEKMVGQGHAGHESWRQASGFYANRTDGILSMVSEEKSERSTHSNGSGKSWKDMTADEVQRESNKRKAEKQKQTGKGQYKAYTKRGETSKSRPLVVRNRTPTPPPPIKKDSPKRSITDRKDPKMNIDDIKASLTDLNRSPSGVHRKTQQEKDRLEEERWLHRSSSFHSDNQRAQNQTREGRKRSNTAPYQHISALPDGLHISPKQPALKKTMLSKKELRIGTPKCEGKKRDVEVLQSIHTSTNWTQTPHPNTTYKPYTQALRTTADFNAAKNQSPTTEEQREDETKRHCQKRIREWAERNEAEQARHELIAALQPIETRGLPPPSLLPHSQSRQPQTPAPDSFGDWERRYQYNARKRGVSGFTSPSISTTVSAFPSYEEMEQERKEKAAEEERRKFSQFMAETGNLRSSEMEWIADSALPMEHDELEKIDRMVDEQLKHQKRATTVILDAVERERATITKPTTALDSLPSQRNLAEARLAQENQEWARKNHEAAAKLEVRSLHATERGTTFSSFQTVAKLSTSTPQGRSGIPRLATGATTTTMQGAMTTPAGRVRPLPGQFGYNNGKKGTPIQTFDTRKRPAKAQDQGSVSKKANTNAKNGNEGTRPGPSGSSPKKDWI